MAKLVLAKSDISIKKLHHFCKLICFFKIVRNVLQLKLLYTSQTLTKLRLSRMLILTSQGISGLFLFVYQLKLTRENQCLFINIGRTNCYFVTQQLLGKGQKLHPEVSPEQTKKRLKEYMKKGKKLENFDHTWMGLDLFTIPTKYFGWEGMTQAFKKVYTI